MSGSSALLVRFALLGSVWAAASGTLPQVFQGSAPEAVPDLEVVGEQEELPALLQLSLDLDGHGGERKALYVGLYNVHNLFLTTWLNIHVLIAGA